MGTRSWYLFGFGTTSFLVFLNISLSTTQDLFFNVTGMDCCRCMFTPASGLRGRGPAYPYLGGSAGVLINGALVEFSLNWFLLRTNFNKHELPISRIYFASRATTSDFRRISVVQRQLAWVFYTRARPQKEFQGLSFHETMGFLFYWKVQHTGVSV